jgi:hypothetical protein
MTAQEALYGRYKEGLSGKGEFFHLRLPGPGAYVEGDTKPVFESYTGDLQTVFQHAAAADQLGLGWVVAKTSFTPESTGVPQFEYRIIVWRELVSEIAPMLSNDDGAEETPNPEPHYAYNPYIRDGLVMDELRRHGPRSRAELAEAINERESLVKESLWRLRCADRITWDSSIRRWSAV